MSHCALLNTILLNSNNSLVTKFELSLYLLILDVAIGAPYEDDLSGCVYVYNGYKDGLWPKYSQRISAKQFDPTPKGFGIAISPAADLNNDDIKGEIYQIL